MNHRVHFSFAPLVLNGFDMQTEKKSTRLVLLSRFDFRFSCDLQVHFACTLQHSVSGRVELLSVPAPKVTTIINGLGLQLNWANKTENHFTDSLSISTEQRGVFAR